MRRFLSHDFKALWTSDLVIVVTTNKIVHFSHRPTNGIAVLAIEHVNVFGGRLEHIDVSNAHDISP